MAAKNLAIQVAPRCHENGEDTDFGRQFHDLPVNMDELDAVIDVLETKLNSIVSNPAVVEKHNKVRIGVRCYVIERKRSCHQCGGCESKLLVHAKTESELLIHAASAREHRPPVPQWGQSSLYKSFRRVTASSAHGPSVNQGRSTRVSRGAR